MAIIYKFSKYVYQDCDFIQQEVIKKLKSSEDYNFAVQEILKSKREIEGHIWKRRASLVVGVIGIGSTSSLTARIGIGILLVAYARYCTKKKTSCEENLMFYRDYYCGIKDSIEADLEKTEPEKWLNYVRVFAYNRRHSSIPEAFKKEIHFEDRLFPCPP